MIKKTAIDLNEIAEITTTKTFTSQAGRRDDDFEDDGAYADDTDEE